MAPNLNTLKGTAGAALIAGVPNTSPAKGLPNIQPKSAERYVRLIIVLFNYIIMLYIFQ